MREIKILLVEDDKKLLSTMRDFLQLQGYTILQAPTGKMAMELFISEQHTIDLIILDVMLPDFNGFQLLEKIRQLSEVPIIMLTAMSSVTDQMSGFRKGADDYIVKPCSLELVNLHINSILKRAGKLRKQIEFGPIALEPDSQLVKCDGKIVDLTKMEFELLEYFMRNQGIVLQRSKILDAVWGYDYNGDVRTVDTLVKQIRKKLPELSKDLRSIYGVGYILGEKENED